ncbi:hypothetical protein [Nocardiopsis lucentensis]|uniref:hypothetical protein n=1 Tax=Nocardiopsis lucentensis TaxID=53441 RepID=UPI00034D0CCE|nr:hypothetical protein [Nocardiopsis lucentensis]
MRAFTKIAVASALAGGLSVVGLGSALAQPPDDPVETVEETTEGVTETAEAAAGDVPELSPEAAALLEDPAVQELLSNPDAVELLSDPDALAVIERLLATDDPLDTLGAVDTGAVEDVTEPVGGVEDTVGGSTDPVGGLV